MRAIDSIFPPRGKSALTHFLYADNVLIFCQASPKNPRAVHSTFELYRSLSGQLLNWKKSNIDFGKGISPARIRDLLSICDMKRGGKSLHYLGVSLFVGAPRQRWLLSWMDNLLARFRCWIGLSLSFAGRVALVSSMIYGSLLHSFQIYRWPSFLLSKMTKAIRNFIWSDSILQKKLVQVSWKKCCRPKEEGGLGLRDLSLLYKALLKKFA